MYLRSHHAVLVLPLRWICIGKGSACSKLIIPNLPRSLGALHSSVIVPPVGIKAYAEFEIAAVINGCVDVKLFKDFNAVEPEFVLPKELV
jgi:hypothetical protein